MRKTRTATRWIGIVLIVVAATGPEASPARPDATPVLSLADLLAPGGALLRDRNGDGVVDFVDAAFVLPEAPAAGEIAAAANIAARLGFESAELNLPLPANGARVSIVVGADALTRAGLTPAEAGLDALGPDEGLVRLVGSSEHPLLVVAGKDSTGTQAAASLLAGRLPYAWDVKGVTLTEVVADIRQFLTKRQAAPTDLRLGALYARAGLDGISRMVVAADFGSKAQAARAEAALRDLVRPTAVTRPAAAAPAPHDPSTVAVQAPGRELSYPGVLTLRLEVSAPGTPPHAADIPRAVAPPAGAAGRRPGGAKNDLDLSSLYTLDGWLGDSDSNLLPDRTETLLVPDGAGTEAAIDLAARIGLESTGVALPIAAVPISLDKPAAEPTLTLIGTAHPMLEQLIKDKKLERPVLEAGSGLIAVVRKAFGEKSAVVITGADPSGLRRATRQVAERFPHIWERGKDRPTLDDVEEQTRQFLAGRSPAGQAAIGLYKMDRLLTGLAGKDIDRATIRLFVDHPDPGLAEFARREAGATLGRAALDVKVEGLDVGRATPVVVNGQPISAEFDVPSEVDEFWTLFRSRVLPRVRKKQRIVVEARLSEPPDIRAQIERDAHAALIQAGADGASTVTVLSAYKQGYSWLYDVVRPALAGKPVARIRIRFAEAGPPPEWKQQAMYIPTRWLLELYPIDEVLARELKLDLTHIEFEKVPIGSPTYEVTATSADGATLLHQTFDPKYVVRPYFDRFPDYEKVRVTTGWLTATMGGVVLADQRIVTDIERFWDAFQAKTLPAIYDYVMLQADGKPRAEDAPHFGALTVDLTLSEPDYALGVDKERISSLEAMHEDIYFGTLQFFDVIGRYSRGPALDYPGRIIPVMHPVATGKSGHAAITFTGFGAARPMVVIEYRERSGREGRVKLDIPKAAVDRPSAMAAYVREGRDGLDRLDLRVKIDTAKDERAALVARAREDRVDAQIVSAEQVAWTLAALGRMRAAGVYTHALAWRDLRELRLVAAWEFEANPANETVATLSANGMPEPLPDIARYLPPGAALPDTGQPPVQWDTPMPPAEAYGVLARLARAPQARVYKAGESYLGQDVWAMDLTSPIRSSHWSQAKASALKPTVIYSARQHANEVSSTSHVLRLAQLLVSDPSLRPSLDKVNVVIHPVTNPDGAQLAYDLYKITPDFMLHAGYLGSLGVDVANAQWDADPIYPESKVRADLWRTWLPDLFLNPHGYPSHEWVQVFSEYAAWVRNRVTESRDWWGMRGWFMPGFSFIDDPKYPRHREAAFDIRARITAAINGDPAMRALNARAYDRYRRYGVQFDQDDFKLDFADNVLIYTALKGSRANPRSADPMVRQPGVTVWSGTTEAPDEPAYGDWMKLVAGAGLEWDKALLRYLVEGRHKVDRQRDVFWGGVSLSWSRARPPKGPEVVPPPVQ